MIIKICICKVIFGPISTPAPNKHFTAIFWNALTSSDVQIACFRNVEKWNLLVMAATLNWV